MSPWNWLFRRKRMMEALDQDIRDFIERETQDNIERGMAPEEARYAALRKFGNVTRVREDTREVWSFLWLEQSWQDFRYGVRQLLKSRGFAISAVLSLALGIGASTAFFSLVYAVVFDPFPYKDADRIVYVQLHGKQPGYGPFRANGSEFAATRNAPSVEGVIFKKPPDVEILTGESSQLAIRADFYSPDVFGVLGVPPLLGRVFTPTDAVGQNTAPIAVLSYSFWMKHYAGDRGVLGRTIELNHKPYMVIGVMPPRFTWFSSDLYLPGAPSADPHEYWIATAKLKPGVDPHTAQAELQVLADRFAKADPDDYPQDSRVKIVTLAEEALEGLGGIITNLFGAAVVLLIIGCANVSILLVARGTTRQHEFAVRRSVGAGRSRLIRQLLTESMLLSLAGAALGVLAAFWAVKAMPHILPAGLLPEEVVVRLNVPVLLFSALAALMTGILFGLSPAIEFSRPQPAAQLQSGSVRTPGGLRARAMHRLPIAGQMALTLLLLCGAGGAAQALWERLHALHGINPDHVLFISMSVESQLPAAATPEQRIQAMEEARRDVAQAPGITAAAWSIGWMPGTIAGRKVIEIRSKPSLNNAEVVFGAISPQLLSVLGVPLLRGRIFDDAEVQRQADVVVVNQAFCKQHLGDLDPIGQRIRIPKLNLNSSSGKIDDWMEVIGVIGDATYGALDEPRARPAVFVPYTFSGILGGPLFARATGDPTTAIHSVKARLGERMIYGQLLQWQLETWGWGDQRLMTEILGLYAGIALVLAAAGLFGVVSFAVTRRTPELGIRMVLGAGRGAVVRLVLTSTATMVGAGLVAGVALSALLAPAISAWGGGSPLTWPCLLGAASILLLVALIACAVPARRAARVDPMVALRYE